MWSQAFFFNLLTNKTVFTFLTYSLLNLCMLMTDNPGNANFLQSMEKESSTVILDANSSDGALEPMIVSQVHSLAPPGDRDSGIHADNEQVNSMSDGYVKPPEEHPDPNDRYTDEKPLRPDDTHQFEEDIIDAEHPLKPREEELNPIEDVVQMHIRRNSIISQRSEAPSLAVDPNDELCGWGPFSPHFCQQFRKPKWVLLWLSLAGVCQVETQHKYCEIDYDSVQIYAL